ncbi:hypothetical protein RJ639_031486 [Escallonia herrerae]|uniref:PSII 6.1 kDa protein n=1 Tax=Escallonia herrerae TaxID=1293975 RepID=A0AA89BDI4_9ASTE|nr:hypothetical protein RJ639_031486 [Escallonia herrerae]
MEGKPAVEEISGSSNMGMMGASLMAAALAATVSSPAMALVDDRMSTEGTGLPFGLSNNLLGWILFGLLALKTISFKSQSSQYFLTQMGYGIHDLRLCPEVSIMVKLKSHN